MAEESPPSSATPVERPRRSLARASSHRRSESVGCTRMLWNIIGNANAARLRHEQAQRLCKVVSNQSTALHRPGPAANAALTARDLAISGAHCVTVSTPVSSGTSATLPPALPGVHSTVGTHMPSPVPTADSVASAAVPHLPCTDVPTPRNVPLPVDTELGPDDIDTTSTRKRSRPSESGSDDEVTRLPTSTPHDADATSETDFQLMLSKSKKRRQRTATSPRPDTSVDTPPGTTTAAHPSFTRYVPACATQLSATQPAVVGAIAAADTIRPSASSPPACGTVLFRPANIGASFHSTSRLAIAQALSALPGVKEVRVNTKKNIVAVDASTAEWIDRLLATSELAGIPVTARPPADRSQSNGVVQGVDGDFTDEHFLAAVMSEVPVIADTRQGTSLVLRFASPRPSCPCAPISNGVRSQAIPASPTSVPAVTRHCSMPETRAVPAMRRPPWEGRQLHQQG
ncbi:hypothetical protein MTO96_043875 [Rhipicephalus appendiculatus]